MQKIIVEKPYEFIPPYRGTFWPTIFRAIRIHDYYLRKSEGVVDYEIRNIDRLRQSLADPRVLLLQILPASGVPEGAPYCASAGRLMWSTISPRCWLALSSGLTV